MVLEVVLYVIILSYILFDNNFNNRGFLAYFCAKYMRSKLNFLQISEVYGICFTTDIDVNLKHMNNVKFLREFEFGRMDFCTRTGLVGLCAGLKNGTNFVISGTILRYRKSVMLFAPYKVTTAAVWWDNRSLYVEQKMITVKDNVVRAVGYTKFSFRNAESLEKYAHNIDKPTLTPELKAYIEANEAMELAGQNITENEKTKDIIAADTENLKE